MSTIRKALGAATAALLALGAFIGTGTAQAAPQTGKATGSAAAYCIARINDDLQGGYSYCVNTVGTHRVALYCEKPFFGRWVYGPWRSSGQESHANCGWFEYATQVFTQ